MKKLYIFGLFLLFMISSNAQEAPTDDTIYIPVISKAIDATFFKLIQQGTEQAAKDFGITTTYEGPKRNEPPELQLELMKTALSKNPQAIVLAALDSEAVKPYLEQAEAAGIPIIGVDTGVVSPIVKTTVSTDNYAAGALAAEKMGELIGRKGKVGIISLDPTSRVAIDRTEGFVDTLKQNYPAIEILPPKYGAGSFEEAKQGVKEYLEAHPDLAGIYGQNASISAGMAEAVKELGKAGDITLIGFDSGKALLDVIREGVVAGAITQDPTGMGYVAMQAALRAYKGEKLPEFIDTGFSWYDRSNMDNPEIKQYLFE